MDACVASCESDDAQVRLAVRLVNAGPLERQGDVPVAVYLLDEDGERSLYEVHGSADLLDLDEDDAFFDNGLTTPTFEVELTLGQARHGVVIVAGDDGTGSATSDDCDSANNEITWAPGC